LDDVVFADKGLFGSEAECVEEEKDVLRRRKIGLGFNPQIGREGDRGSGEVGGGKVWKGRRNNIQRSRSLGK
jgi:hypothetical protein